MRRNGIGVIVFTLFQRCYYNGSLLKPQNDEFVKSVDNEKQGDTEKNISDEYLRLLMLNEPEGYKPLDANGKKHYKLEFKPVKQLPIKREDAFEYFFNSGKITNTSKDDSRVDGKIYFEVLKVVLEEFLARDELLKQLIGTMDNNNHKNLEEMFDETLDIINYAKILLNFVYYTLYVSKDNIINFYNQINTQKDCGEMDPKDILEIFFKTFMSILLGHDTSLGITLEESPNSYDDIDKLTHSSERLKDYGNLRIEVNSHFFGESHTTQVVYLLKYVFIVIRYSISNVLRFHNHLPKIIQD